MEVFQLIKKYNEGQTLLEAVVALTVLLLILTASSVAIITSVNNAVFEKNQTLANKYAQEGMEYIRTYKIGNPQKFATYNGPGPMCISDLIPIATPLPTEPAGGCSVIGTTQFRRSVEFSDTPNCGNWLGPPPASLPGKHVKVVVEWQSGKCTAGDYCNKAELDTCF